MSTDARNVFVSALEFTEDVDCGCQDLRKRDGCKDAWQCLHHRLGEQGDEHGECRSPDKAPSPSPREEENDGADQEEWYRQLEYDLLKPERQRKQEVQQLLIQFTHWLLGTPTP